MCLGFRRGVWVIDKDLRVIGVGVVVEGKGMDEDSFRCLYSIRRGLKVKFWGKVNFF